MEIGRPQRIYTIEPIEDPVPAPSPKEPDESRTERNPKPTKEPARRP
jgi:hypothetical protein